MNDESRSDLCTALELPNSCAAQWLVCTCKDSKPHLQVHIVEKQLSQPRLLVEFVQPLYMHAYVRACTHVHTNAFAYPLLLVKQLPSNQSFDKQISSHQNGGGVSRWGEWVRKATAYKFDTCTLIGVHEMHGQVDPN